MTYTLRSARSAAAGIVILAVVLSPNATYAQSVQSPSRPQTGIYVGGSVGVHLETSESGTGQAVAGSGLIGYQFNAGWAIQGEFGGMGNVECFEAWVSPDCKETVCDSAPVLNLDAIRPSSAGPRRRG